MVSSLSKSSSKTVSMTKKKAESLNGLLGIGLNDRYTWKSALRRIMLLIFLEKILKRGKKKKEKRGTERKEPPEDWG